MCVIDLTPMSGKFAWVCLKNKVGYVAITTGQPMNIALRGHLVDLLKQEMSIPGSKVYNAGYAVDAEPEKTEKKKGKQTNANKKQEAKAEKGEEACSGKGEEREETRHQAG